MHRRASNSELVEPLPEPERTLNRRLRRRNRRVPFKQRNEPPTQPKVVYALILDINYFCHFLDILENYNPIDDEPMWAVDRVVTSTPGFAITIPETANEFAIKDTKNEAIVRLMMFPLSLTGEVKTWLDELNEGIIETWDELHTAFISRFFPPALFGRILGEIQAFSQHENETITEAWLRMKEMLRNFHGSRNSNTNKIMARMDAMTMKIDDRYKEFQSRSKQPNIDHNDDDKPMSPEEEAKFMQTFCRTRFYNDYRDRDSNRDNWRLSRRNDYNQDNYRSNSNDKPDLKKQLGYFIKAQHSTNSFVKDTFMDLKTKLETTTKNHQASIQNLKAKFNKLAEKQSARHSGSLPSNTQPNSKGSSSKAYQPPDDEDEEPTPQPKVKDPKPVKETLIPKHDLSRSNQCTSCRCFSNDESSAMIQNKVPPKLGDPESFLIPCNFSKAFSCNALADLSASINLMPYSLYAKLSLKSLKLTKMSISLFSKWKKTSKVPLILGRPFLYTADAVIRVKQKQLNLGVGTERMIFHIDSAMKHSYLNDDTCFSIDVIDEILEEDFDSLLDEGSKILHSIKGTILKEKLYAEFDEFMAMTVDENSESESDTEEPPLEKTTFNTNYKIKTSLEEPPSDLELKPLLDNLEYTCSKGINKWYQSLCSETLIKKNFLFIQRDGSRNSPKQYCGKVTPSKIGSCATEEKVQKKNDVKARSMLLMALPNEHQLTFNQYKDAKTLFEAIQTRFGGNDATKKTQKTLLKQMLQKIISQLAILGENISQEDLNLKFLRSLPSEWNTHVVVWRNKPDLDLMSFDDLYNNFKIVEQEVKRTVTSSSNSGSQNVAFVSTPSSTNEVNTANVQVSTASYTVSTDSTHDNTANLSDAIVYAFLANQPNGSQLVHEDIEQIHEDDLEEMDLKWQLALLSMRARRYYQRTGKKITINGSDTAGYDKSKVECFNCHKMGHFARECRGPRNQESRPRNQDSSRRTVNVEDTSSKAMVAIDGAGFDWSYMADEEVPTNLALMAFSDSEVHNNKTCSNTCLKSFETLKTQLDNLRVEFNKSEFNLATYKRGLASVEEQLVFYKKNEVIKGVGYNAVPPPPTGLFAPPTIDLSNSGLKEFQQPEFKGYGFKANKGDESEVRILKSDNVQQKPKQANQYRKVSKNPRELVKGKSDQFGTIPTAVLTKSGIVPVSAARPINTAAPKSFMNAAKTRPNAF
ncbi:putative ribonuclease H-like domain-containing protein [Tanacetum coccineum]